MYYGITKIYYRKTAGHVFTKPVTDRRNNSKLFPPVSCFSSNFKLFVPCIFSTYGMKTNWCHCFNFIRILPDLYMFRAHRPIFRRVHTAVHTTIGSVSLLLWSRALYVIAVVRPSHQGFQTTPWSVGTGCSTPGDNAAGAWSWPSTSTKCCVWEPAYFQYWFPHFFSSRAQSDVRWLLLSWALRVVSYWTSDVCAITCSIVPN